MGLRFLRKFASLTPFLLAIAACSTLSDSEMALRTTDAGFSQEMDEPAGRGLVKRVSPDGLDVEGSFVLTPDSDFIVFSARQQEFVTEAKGIFAQPNQAVFDLWKAPLKGGAAQKIVAGGDDDVWSPSFTSDGKFIVFESGGEIWKVKADGTGGKYKITGSRSTKDMWPKLSAKDMLVFCSSDSNDHSYIWTCNLDGGELTRLREGLNPAWSPDDSLIAYSFEGELWTMNGDGSNPLRLTTSSQVYKGVPSFSPDGSRIAYASNEGKDGKPADFNIWTMRADGSEKARTTELSSWDSWPLWARAGIYFLSARATADKHYQTIWITTPRLNATQSDRMDRTNFR